MILYNSDGEPLVDVPDGWIPTPGSWVGDRVTCHIRYPVMPFVASDDASPIGPVCNTFTLREVRHRSGYRHLVLVDGLERLVDHEDVASWPRARAGAGARARLSSG